MSHENLIAELRTVEHGFGPIRDHAVAIFNDREPDAAMTLAQEFLESDVHQVRMLATLLLGMLAHCHPDIPEILRDRVSADDDWRVQEMLAMAFDTWCRDTGYESALPVIREWLADPRPNVRRAVSEGLRPWTSRPWFKQRPEQAIALLALRRDDPSPYVRKSAGNALRDISRKHPDLIRAELANWDVNDPSIAFTHKLAAKLLP